MGRLKLMRWGPFCEDLPRENETRRCKICRAARVRRLSLNRTFAISQLGCIFVRVCVLRVCAQKCHRVCASICAYVRKWDGIL